jgi:hypothetical protein
MSLSLELAELFRRDITRVRQQLEAFPDDAALWKQAPHCANSPGNLALHLEGNLREYIGRQLGQIAYQRRRDEEFTRSAISVAEMGARFGELAGSIPAVIAGLSEEALSAAFPENVLGKPLSTRQFLIHLLAHLSYHNGQIDYSRRILTGEPALKLAGL